MSPPALRMLAAGQGTPLRAQLSRTSRIPLDLRNA